jgi:hypothetical protein
MSDEQKPPKQFPYYPQGIPIAGSKDAGMLAKMINRGIKARHKSSSGKKGIAANQSIHIGKRKTKFW